MGLAVKAVIRVTIFSGSPEAPEASVLTKAIQGMLVSSSNLDGKLYRINDSQLEVVTLSNGTVNSYPINRLENVKLVSVTKIS